VDGQKALLVTDASGGLDDLNLRLQRGWRVATVEPMGGGGQTAGFAALVIVERTDQATEVLSEIADELDEVIGDGGTVAIEDALGRLERDDELGT
jgi:hypothetical protein